MNLEHVIRTSIRVIVFIIIKHAKTFLAGVFLATIANVGGTAFATIDPNSYTVNMTMQNQNQGIEIFDGSTTERYASTMRTLTVSTNAPSGYRIYVSVPSDDHG